MKPLKNSWGTKICSHHSARVDVLAEVGPQGSICEMRGKLWQRGPIPCVDSHASGREHEMPFDQKRD